MLAAQVLAITLSLELRLVSQLGWFIDLDKEFNIPASFSATQFALAGGIALAAAGVGRALPVSRRLYHFALAAVLLFLAWDEYFLAHERIFRPLGDWEYIYVALGVGIGVATLSIAWRSPRQMRIWGICLLTGLAMAASGALLLEQLGSRALQATGILARKQNACCARLKSRLSCLASGWSWSRRWACTPNSRRRHHFVPAAQCTCCRSLCLRCLMLYSLFIHGTLGWIQIGIKRQQSEWSLASEFRARAQPTSIQFGEEILLRGMDLDHDREALRVLLFLDVFTRAVSAARLLDPSCRPGCEPVGRQP